MPGRRIPHDLRLELYRRVLELHNRGVSYRKIQRILREEYGVEVSRSNISYWVRGLHIPEREPYNHPDMSKERELAWIAGAYAGDGSIKVNRKGRFFSLKVKDRELAKEAAKKLAVVMRRDEPYAVGRLADGRYYVEVQSRELVDHFSRRENIFEHLRRNPREFIQAFFDCEGSVIGGINKQGYFRYTLFVANTDRELLEEIRSQLRLLGIEPYEIYIHQSKGKVIRTSKGVTMAKKNLYAFGIYGLENLSKFREEIGFVSERKKRKLRDIVDILEEHDLITAAVEWVRRYKYVEGSGRERWFPRRTPLSLEEAWEEYEGHLRKLGSPPDGKANPHHHR